MISPTRFETKDWLDDYPGLADMPGHIAFTDPFTLADFGKWHDALRQAFDKSDDEGGSLLRQFRAALAVISEWDIAVFGLEQATAVSDDLPMELISWVTDAADSCIAQRIRVETPKAAVLRVANNQKAKGNTVVSKAADYIGRYPDLERYGEAKISFTRSFSRAHYRNWTKALELDNARKPYLFANQLFSRSWRGALTLLEKWNVPGVNFHDLTADGAAVPLEIASWVVDAADEYLGARLNLKKLRSPSAIL